MRFNHGPHIIVVVCIACGDSCIPKRLRYLFLVVRTTKYVIESARRSQFPTCLPSQTGHVCEDNRSGGVAILMSLFKALRRFVVVSQELRFELAYHVLHKTR